MLPSPRLKPTYSQSFCYVRSDKATMFSLSHRLPGKKIPKQADWSSKMSDPGILT